VAKRKKKASVKKKFVPNMVKPDEISVGDVCYFVGSDSSIRYGEVVALYPKDNLGPSIQMLDQVNGSYHVTLIRLAAWDQKSLKGKKWDIKADLKRYIDEER
jgi:hypothetical protein